MVLTSYIVMKTSSVNVFFWMYIKMKLFSTLLQTYECKLPLTDRVGNKFEV